MTKEPVSKHPAQPAVILYGAQLGENIGASARAMRNFALSDLRLVAPRTGWSRAKARAMAAGGADILARARLFDTLPLALSDLNYVLATSARRRERPMAGFSPESAARQMRKMQKAGSVGILFGPERSGLSNDALALCNGVIEIPAAPAFSSLNLAQSVLLVGYAWYCATTHKQASVSTLPPAPKGDLYALFEQIEGGLDAAGYFRPPEKRAVMVRTLRAMLQKPHWNAQEVRTLRGVIGSLLR